jgi:hypothetical protein
MHTDSRIVELIIHSSLFRFCYKLFQYNENDAFYNVFQHLFADGSSDHSGLLHIPILLLQSKQLHFSFNW